MESPIRKTLEYFDKYDYPLTKKELELWISPVSPSSVPPLNLRGGRSRGVIYKDGYFFLKNRNNLINIRKLREKYSIPKWKIAHDAANKLSKISFVEAIFVTGSLSMSNCKKNDDIDLMIITKPDTLWITRFVTTLMFWKNRRLPGQKTAPNKICTNLWLDIKNLKLKIKNLYIAHEILQAKCIYNKNNTYANFLYQNSWVKEYLPNAYKYQISNIKKQKYILKISKFFAICNLIFYFVQYLYMLPKMKNEKVGLGYAFFHPSP